VRVVECPLLEAGPQALAGAFLERPPTHLFLVHGTTRRRARLEGLDVDPYLTVDLGLTSLALEACRDLTPPPRVVLLSSQGAGPGARGAYLRARHLAEEAVRASGLPYTIARAPLITGPDRGEPRPLERLGGVALRALTRGLRAGGARATAARYTPPSWPRASPTRASTTRPSPGSSRRRSSAGRPPWTAWPPSRPRAATTHATEPP
jgi:nucleoside-diphosphate-sugar epimerase